MTDKQIIIDGVDVSGCEWFYKNDPCKNTCKYFCTPCEWVEIQKCMYKYAKCKEQECDQLKAENKHLNDLLNQALKELEKTRETLTEIKEICKEESGWVNCSNNMPTETAQFAQEILQKISECEGNDELTK